MNPDRAGGCLKHRNLCSDNLTAGLTPSALTLLVPHLQFFIKSLSKVPSPHPGCPGLLGVIWVHKGGTSPISRTKLVGSSGI